MSLVEYSPTNTSFSGASYVITDRGSLSVCSDDAFSVITCDDETVDIVKGKIHSTNWITQGSKVPSQDDEDLDYFRMVHINKIFYMTNVERSYYIVMTDPKEAIFEISPVCIETLNIYYKYFKACGAMGARNDMLLNLCDHEIKSPVFDIPKCNIVRFSDMAPKKGVSCISIDGVLYGIFIPAEVTSAIIKQLGTQNVHVDIPRQDMITYESIRVCPSPFIVVFSMSDPNIWARGYKLLDVNENLMYDAVTTASFTVSVLLKPSHKNPGRHTSKYILSYIIHNIK